MKIDGTAKLSLIFVLTLVLGLGACASAGPVAGGWAVEVTATPLEASAASGSEEALFIGGYQLKGTRPEFGGFSGLVVEPGGRLVAVSDRGYWWEQPLRQSASGMVELAGPGRMGPLHDFGGRVPEDKARRDAEEMTLWPGGQLVSYEGEHRIAFYRAPRRARLGEPAAADRLPRKLTVPAELDGEHDNGGLEAMTRLRDGRLAVFSEEQRGPEGQGLLWVGQPTHGLWRRLELELFEDFVPTSAATLPNGDVLLLERSYTETRGVRGRVRRLERAAFATDPSGGRPPIAGKEILRLEPPQAVDNFEGIEILPMADGRIFFLLLSDDNYNAAQRILLLEFELLSP